MSFASLRVAVAEIITEAVKSAYPQLISFEPEISEAANASFGDYQCNSAMKLAKELGVAPRTIASAIVQALPESSLSLFEKVGIAGPGFINMTIRPQYLSESLLHKIQTGQLLSQVLKSQRVIIDFSSPNIAKEMHVGHLRSTIIGESLCRIFEALGHDVVRLNHVGDWGTAFGMLIAHIKDQPNYSLSFIGACSLADLMRFYKESKVRFDEDPVFKKRSQLEVVKLQGGDDEALNIWRIICDISERAYQEIYSLLDVQITVRGESFYNPMLPKIVQELESKGLVTISDDAKCIFLEGFSNREGNSLPLMLQKSDGGYTYDTTDLAAIAQRIREEKADRIIYITDSGQATHFQMIFKAAREAGILDSRLVRVDHVPFGLVLGPDGKKFKTRSGETEKLIDLLNTAIVRSEQLLREKNPDWTEEEYRSVAKILGIGAVKYADLSSHRVSDYTFSYDRMLRFEGNTAAFIMYSFVRTASIQRKIGQKSLPLCNKLSLNHPSEIALALHLCRFQDTVDEVSETLLPHRLTEYLYGLAEAFNGFFRDCRVEGDPRQEERLSLVALTGQTLKKGLMLLGIDVPSKM